METTYVQQQSTDEDIPSIKTITRVDAHTALTLAYNLESSGSDSDTAARQANTTMTLNESDTRQTNTTMTLNESDTAMKQANTTVILNESDSRQTNTTVDTE